MFRNIRFYRVHGPWPESEKALSEKLSEREFSPCGRFSERSAGWEPPSGQEGDSLCRHIAGADLLQLRTQSRVLPAAAVKEALEGRVADYRERTSEEPSSHEIRKLKEQTRDELMSRSLVKSDRTKGFFLRKESILGIDAATPTAAEWFLEHLRMALGQLNAVPLTFSEEPLALLNRLFLGHRVARFQVGRECRMQEASDSRSIVTWRELDLEDFNIRQHLDEGLKLTHLGVAYDSCLSFLLSSEAVITKLKFLGGEAADVTDDEDPLARQDAEFVLLTGIVQRLINDLASELGGLNNQD
ncbi:MAG TPA: recombination-associated protein RdgC [Xanthomonadales bacterium]|nr:recombination-associated protein RdgC [Xanthomonadales bacterium]